MRIDPEFGEDLIVMRIEDAVERPAVAGHEVGNAAQLGFLFAIGPRGMAKGGEDQLEPLIDSQMVTHEVVIAVHGDVAGVFVADALERLEEGDAFLGRGQSFVLLPDGARAASLLEAVEGSRKSGLRDVPAIGIWKFGEPGSADVV